MTQTHHERSFLTAIGYHALIGVAPDFGASPCNVVLPGEDRALFEELRQYFIQDFAPRDIVEKMLVDELADLTWKKMRVAALDKSELLSQLKAAFGSDEFHHYLEPKCDAVTRIRTMGASAYAYRDAYFEALRMRDITDVVAADWPRLKRHFPLLYAAFERAAQSDLDPPQPRKRWIDAVVFYVDGRRMPFPRHVLIEFIKNYEDLDWVFHNLDYVFLRIQETQQRRLLKLMDNRRGDRILADLDSTYQKKLKALRDHRDWRRSHREITVDPDPGGDEAASKKLGAEPLRAVADQIQPGVSLQVPVALAKP